MRLFMLGSSAACVMVLAANSACGPNPPTEPPLGPSGTGGVQVVASGGALGAGGAETGAGGSSIDGEPDCSGDFKNPQMILDGGRITSPAITGDELELYYIFGETFYEQIYVSRRTSTDEAFSLGAPVPELNETCDGLNATLDVSFDGLRLYLSCYTDADELIPLLLLTRPDRDSAFGSPVDLGLFTMAAALSADELTVYGARFGSDVATRMATRSSLTAPFGSALSAPGLEQAAMFAPGVSTDSLEIYGAPGAEKVFSVSRRSSSSEPFGAPQALPQLLGSYRAAGAAEVTENCRSLIYPAVDADGQWALLRAER